MERVDLRRMRKAGRQRWRNGDEWDPRATKIVVGVLADGRWYVHWYDLTGDPPVRGCAYGGRHAEHYARATARRWKRTFGGEWVEA